LSRIGIVALSKSKIKLFERVEVRVSRPNQKLSCCFSKRNKIVA